MARRNSTYHSAHSAIRRQSHDSTPRHTVQICASLVENPANLGSLCRTADVFRAERLMVADLAVTEQPAFYKPAVSAHRWQPMQACAVAGVPDWLDQQRQAGYTRLALHLDKQAVSLTEFTFPRQVVLVLGRELTGVPQAILEHCDRTLVIPQYGQVESLNVQTAAAIALYEYVRQWGNRCEGAREQESADKQ